MATSILGSNSVQAVADEPIVRVDETGAVIVVPRTGYELVRRSKVFNASTAVGGVAPGTSVSTTGGFALQNPDSNAGVTLLVLLSVRMAYLSGTLGAGAIALVRHAAGADFTGTAITPMGSYLGSGTATGLPFTTATVPASGTVVRYLFSLQASLASTAVTPWYMVADFTNDPIIIPGAEGISLQGITAAGSTPLVLYSVTWAEVAATVL